MPDQRTIFADGLFEANVIHGVARMTLAQTGADGKPAPVGQLVMPLAQLPGFTNGLLALLKQVEQRLRESGAAAPSAPAPAAAPIEAPMPSAFRFQG